MKVLFFYPGQVYLMEVLDTKRREVFGSTLALSINIGITLVYALGALTNSWVAVAWIFAGLVILQCLGLIFIPKSPQWLICNGRTDEAKQSLKMLRGPNADIAKEIELLKNAAKLNEEINLSEAHNNASTNSWREFLEPEVYKPLSLLVLVFILQQLSGPFAVVSYAVTIFKRILHGDSAPKLASISVGAIRIVGSVLAVVLLKKKFSKRLQVHFFTYICNSTSGKKLLNTLLLTMILNFQKYFTDDIVGDRHVFSNGMLSSS